MVNNVYYDGICAVCGRPLQVKKSVYIPYGRKGNRSYLCRRCFPTAFLCKLWDENELLCEIIKPSFWDLNNQLQMIVKVINVAGFDDIDLLSRVAEMLFDSWGFAVARLQELERYSASLRGAKLSFVDDGMSFDEIFTLNDVQRYLRKTNRIIVAAEADEIDGLRETTKLLFSTWDMTVSKVRVLEEKVNSNGKDR